MIGQTIAHYEILEKLGEGGMGEVYRATDSKLGRDVAIKILPEAFVADSDRLVRFNSNKRKAFFILEPTTLHPFFLDRG